MPKTKLLITAMSLNIGGAEKSLVNLLNLIDFNEYDVDLLLFQRTGDLLAQVPKHVNILSVSEIDILYGAKPRDRTPVMKKVFLGAWRYIASGAIYPFEKQFDRRRIMRWVRFFSARIPKLRGHYDCALSYSGGETFWYIAEKVTADRKVSFFHSDYSNIDINVSLESRYLAHADVIATISDVCADSLRRLFPEYANRIVVVHNPSSPALLQALAAERPDNGFSSDCKLKIVSVGRLHQIKGFDLAAEAAAILSSRKVSYEWIVVGDGDQYDKLKTYTENHDISDSFRLVGMKSNPYPYISGADVLVQPSRFEGKSMVLDEAKALGVPVIVTDYPSASDQVENDVNGLIVEMNPTSIADALTELAEDSSRLSRYRAALPDDNVSDLADISDFIDLIEG